MLIEHEKTLQVNCLFGWQGHRVREAVDQGCNGMNAMALEAVEYGATI